MRPILVTGFTPFAGLADNPSAIVVEHLAAAGVPGVALATRLIDVVWDTAGRELLAAIDEIRPAAVVCFGLARGRDAINLERFAVNIDDTATADNAGAYRRGIPIDPDGPAAYRSTLPLAAMEAALADAGLPVRQSNHAGGFLCNHFFYVARHRLTAIGSTIPAGFVHLPPLPPEAGALAAEAQCRAARIIIQTLASAIGEFHAADRLAG
ncbi:pyroglutamyl-peptidase [Stella humosa]|uniref:Pyrrolidone-carboxylate peptidase n=1 Tax=Stella humosa TaxID=94 RepID=A0A3N1KU79_9PROT|nr:pyrrolidone-carboxylate peptidase [Stella humosa]ROP84131.1 pyroglutamyl-peptidase [Stella humosa]BBK33641.1 pyrrolidone-carboxylate peptidase [Stella humosa]